MIGARVDKVASFGGDLGTALGSRTFLGVKWLKFKSLLVGWQIMFWPISKTNAH